MPLGKPSRFSIIDVVPAWPPGATASTTTVRRPSDAALTAAPGRPVPRRRSPGRIPTATGPRPCPDPRRPVPPSPMPAATRPAGCTAAMPTAPLRRLPVPPAPHRLAGVDPLERVTVAAEEVTDRVRAAGSRRAHKDRHRTDRAGVIVEHRHRCGPNRLRVRRCRRGTLEFELKLVEVAPIPVLARFVRSDDRMPGQAEVRCRVPPRRVVTASYVTASLADP